LEIQKLYDLDDIEFEDITIALVRLAKDIPAHEFFYKINQNNNLSFSRKKDLVFHGDYFDYFITSFQRPALPLFLINLRKVSKKKFKLNSLQKKKTLSFY